MGIPKIAAEDTSILVGNINGEKTAVPIPKGSLIQIDTAGLHYNRTTSLFVFSDSKLKKANVVYSKARYWEDPHAFKPERFLKDWPRDAFLPFSAGARACIGRKSVIFPSCNTCLFAELILIQIRPGSSRRRVLQFSQCSCLSIKSQSRRNPSSLLRRLSRGKPGFWTVLQSSR